MFRPIGMPPEMLRERVEKAARAGDPGARMMLAALEATPRVRSGRRPDPSRPWAGHPIAMPAGTCEDCGRRFRGSDPCRCLRDPTPAAVSPGPRPLAREAAMLDEKRDPRAAFSAGELQVARDSVQAHGGAGVAFLDGEIGRNVLRGTSAFNFCRRLDALKAAGARAAVVRVTSGGGDIAEGLAMIRALERFSAETGPVVAFVAGLAGSMASAVALSADYVIADPLAGRFFMHEPSGGTDEHRASLRERIVGIYEARTLLDRTMIEGFMAGEVTLDAYSAHSHGLVDEVADIPRVEVVARAAATAGGLWAAPIRAANSWRRHVLRERQAYAEGCARYGRRP